jgi:DNA-directed RNA polymerase subunit RPC12/RpoP
MIKPICSRCGEKLTKFGAILLSPPDKKDKIKKYHICKDCFKLILLEFKIYPRG